MATFEFWYTLLLLIAMTIVLIKEIIEPDIVIFLVLLLFVLGGVINVEEAFVGFSNQGMLTVGFLFIVAEALNQTGVLNNLGAFLLGADRASISMKLTRFLFPVSALSAFFNNTPIVAMLIPAVYSWAKKNGYAVSKFLIPLSYATILGGTCTLIGTSTNLVVHGMMIESQVGGLGFFEISKIGIPIAIVGILFMSTLGHRILPDRKEPIIELGENTREFVVQLKVQAKYQHLGKTLENAGLRHLKGLFLFQIEREQHTIAPVSPDEKIQLGDRLFFTGLPKTIIELQKTPGLSLLKDSKFDLKNYDSRIIRPFEVVVSHSSPLINRNVRDSNFRSQYNAVIMAIHRNGERIQKKIGDIVLREGDTLLILARHDFHKHWYNSKDFYLISESEKIPSKPRWYRYFSIVIFLAMIGLMACEILPIVIVTGLTAIIFILSRCLLPHEARSSIQWNVLLIIASAFGISQAIENAGVAQFLANRLITIFGALGVFGVLSVVYFLTSLYTEIITNNAAAALLFPIALATAQQMGVDPRPFAIAIAFGASASFATPIGYQTNLMVYGPGGYKFGDFLKIGAPLNIFIGMITIILIYFFYLA